MPKAAFALWHRSQWSRLHGLHPAVRQHHPPWLRYRDAHAAIAWLCKAFGFAKHAVYENEQGGVEHTQLTYGNGMVMPGEVRDNAFGQHIAQPDEIGGRERNAPA